MKPRHAQRAGAFFRTASSSPSDACEEEVRDGREEVRVHAVGQPAVRAEQAAEILHVIRSFLRFWLVD